MFETVSGVNMSSSEQLSNGVSIKVEVKTEEEEIDTEDDSNDGELVVDLQDDPSTVSSVEMKEEEEEKETNEVEIIDPSKWNAKQLAIEEDSTCQMCTEYRKQLEDLMKDETKSEEIKMVCKKFEEHRADARTCGEKTFICSECGKKFFWIKELKRHRVLAHKHFKCKLCTRKFSDAVSLRTHQKFKHEVLLVYNCESCDRAFFKARDLYEHEKIHSEEKSDKQFMPKCPTCKRVFAKMDQYESHKCYSYVCELCKRRFSCDENFESHKCDDLKPYQCKFCKKSFVMAGNFKAHELRCRLKERTEEKNVECTICNKFFKNLKAMIVHQRSHSGKRECPVCKKCFGSTKMMKLHELTHKAIECFNLGSLNI